MASALYTDVKRKEGRSAFWRPAEGLFGLRIWAEAGMTFRVRALLTMQTLCNQQRCDYVSDADVVEVAVWSNCQNAADPGPICRPSAPGIPYRVLLSAPRECISPARLNYLGRSKGTSSCDGGEQNPDK